MAIINKYKSVDGMTTYDLNDARIADSDITNWNGKTSNAGTITEVQANGTSVATSGVANIPAASTSKYGVTKLSSATNSTSTTLAATASAVKAAYDHGGVTSFNGSTGAVTYTAPVTKVNQKTGDVVLYASDITMGSGDPLSVWAALSSKAPLASPTFTGTPEAPTATAGTNTTQIATTEFVTTAVSNGIASAQAGAAKYKGTVGTGGTVTALPTSGYAVGDYYVVKTAGTYAGETCEVGDMIFCNSDYASGQTASAVWDVVQTNIVAISNSEIDTILAS